MRMEGHARTWFTPKQKAELWERWKSGQCVADIARALERRNKSGVYRVLAGNGGIAPAPRRRALVALRLEEREEISRGIAAGFRRMDADYNQSLILVVLRPSTNIRKCAQPIDAGVCPEIDEDDFSAQC